MKRFIILSFIISLAIMPSLAQTGIGIGSHGINFRTNPQAKNGVIVRTGFGFSGADFQAFFNPEAAWIRRHHYSGRTKLYAGIGATGRFSLSFEELSFGYGLMVPVGLELFPIAENQRISVSLETGLHFIDHNNNDSFLGNYGLIEFTFYLGRPK